MKTECTNKAHIYSISAETEPGYVWKWRNGKEQSKRSFVYYYDCVNDARQHGHDVELSRAVGLTAPGGASYVLEMAAVQKDTRA